MLEQELQTAGCTQRTTVLVEITTYICYSTSRIVCRSFHKNSNTERTISLVVHFFIIGKILRDSPLDSTFDIIFRHVLFFSSLHHYTQTRIVFRFRSTLFCSYRNFFTQLSKYTGHIAPTLKLSRFTKLKRSSHMFISLSLFYVIKFLSQLST